MKKLRKFKNELSNSDSKRTQKKVKDKQRKRLQPQKRSKNINYYDLIEEE